MTKRRTARSTGGKKIGVREFIISLLLIAVLWGVQECTGLDLLNLSPTAEVETEPVGAIQIYFTTPAYPEEESDRYGGVDEKLAAAIDGAQKSVDMAAFELDLPRVTDALIRADKRGVEIRMVTDSDYAEDLGPERLDEAGIPVVFDDRDPFMHDKFVVIDGVTVWTGSWNLTINGTYRNNNNLVVIQSTKLADNYTTEFREMFEDGKFGASSPDDTPHPQINLDGTLIENHFESEGNVRPRLVELINGAEESVYFLAFSFTDDEIAKAMIDRHRAGIEVRGVIEARNASGTGSDMEAMAKAGIDVLEDGNPYVMHHKVIIIDGEIVTTGSYNFSQSAADKNDENVLIIHNATIAEQYTDEFQRVYQRAEEAQ
ncbi:MAG: DUF1669 domain-containing protein [Anaerolineae bacterium]|nr:DUF1669 domain-containing protein [Anaerolineae bacterium]